MLGAEEASINFWGNIPCSGLRCLAYASRSPLRHVLRNHAKWTSSVGAPAFQLPLDSGKGGTPRSREEESGVQGQGLAALAPLDECSAKASVPARAAPSPPSHPLQSATVSLQCPSVLGFPFSSSLHLCRQSLYQTLLTLPNWSVPSASCQDPD